MPIIVRPAVSKLAVNVYGMPTFAAAIAAARISSSDDIVSIQATSAPPSLRPRICSSNTSIAICFGQHAERLEQVAGGPDRTRDDDGASCLVCDRAGDLRGETVDFTHAVLHAVEHQSARVTAEAVGQDDVRVRVDETLVQMRACGRVLEVPHLGASPEVRPIANRFVPVAPSASRVRPVASRVASMWIPG